MSEPRRVAPVLGLRPSLGPGRLRPSLACWVFSRAKERKKADTLTPDTRERTAKCSFGPPILSHSCFRCEKKRCTSDLVSAAVQPISHKVSLSVFFFPVRSGKRMPCGRCGVTTQSSVQMFKVAPVSPTAAEVSTLLGATLLGPDVAFVPRYPARLSWGDIAVR